MNRTSRIAVLAVAGFGLVPAAAAAQSVSQTTTTDPASTETTAASSGSSATGSSVPGETTPLTQAVDVALADHADGIATSWEMRGVTGTRPVTYSVEVCLPDGAEVDVLLDEAFAVTDTRTDDDRDDDDDCTTDDGLLDEVSLADAYDAATAVLGDESVVEATITDVSHDDDGYDVEAIDADNQQWEIELDSAFELVTIEQDD